MRSIRTALATCVAIVAIGCGSVSNNTDGGDNADGAINPDGGGGADGGGGICDGPSVAIENVAECFRLAICNFFSRCQGIFADEAECLTNFDVLFPTQDAFIARQVAAEGAGVVTYDGELAFTCFDAITGDTCSLDDLVVEQACNAFFSGTKQQGEACTIAEECGVGGRCDRMCDEAECCMGTCVVAVGVGASCDNNPCLPGLRCAGNAGAQICTTGDAGASCLLDFDCDTNYYCDAGTSQCVADLADGAACTDDDQCLADLQCVANVCRRSEQVGDLCEGFCVGPTFCDESVATPGTCEAYPGLGQDCSESFSCASFALTCDGVTRTCVNRANLGQSCDSVQCATNLFCDSAGGDICQAKKANGQLCPSGSDSECQSAACVGGACIAYGVCF